MDAVVKLFIAAVCLIIQQEAVKLGDSFDVFEIPTSSSSDNDPDTSITLPDVDEMSYIHGQFVTSTPKKPKSGNVQLGDSLILFNINESSEMDITDQASTSSTDFGRVQPKARKPKHVNDYILSEISSGKKLKEKALTISNIRKERQAKCTCGKDCGSDITDMEVYKFREEFWTMPPAKRFSFITETLKECTMQNKKRFVNFKGNQLCSSGLMTLLRISKNLYYKALNNVKGQKTSAIGKSVRMWNSNTLEMINWLEEYASFYGDRMPHKTEVLLPYKTKKCDVCQLYKKETTNAVSESQFFKIWKLHFPHLKIKKTNSFSKCSTCVTLERELERNTCPLKRSKYRRLRDEHNERQMMERRYYYSKREKSEKSPLMYLSIIIDGMDQSKSALPHFAGRLPKFVNPAELLKTHITGVISHGLHSFSTHIDYNQYPHDPNLTINVILKNLLKTAKQMSDNPPKVLFIQADNCWRENKNRYVLGLCELLVSENIFHEVHLSFLYVGHTHEDIDAGFSRIADKLRHTDAETIPNLLALLPDGELLSDMFDVRGWVAPHLSDITQISKPLHYKFSKYNHELKVHYKGSYSGTWTDLKSTILTSLPDGEPKVLKPVLEPVVIERVKHHNEAVKHFFKHPDSYGWWVKFLKFETRESSKPVWILKVLPRQKDSDNIANLNEDVPDHVRILLSKETTTSTLHVRNKRTVPVSNTRPESNKQGRAKKPLNQKTKKTTGKDKSKPNRKGRRRRIFTVSNTMLIRYDDETKKHIWIMIFLEHHQMTLLFVYLFLMAIFLCLTTIYVLIDYIKSLMTEMIHFHISLHKAVVAVCRNYSDVTCYYDQPSPGIHPLLPVMPQIGLVTV